MNRPAKIAIIGAGGIACHLLPSLSRLTAIHIVDGDKYEPKNADRQFPALKSEGNKAEVLAKHIKPVTSQKVTSQATFMRDVTTTMDKGWKGVEMIIGCVDNNASRRIIAEVAEMLNIPAIMGGNHHAHGEAHLFVPNFYNPFDHFEFPDTEPTPWACNAAETIEEFPQTPMANFMASAAIMHILLSWEQSEKPQNMICHSRLDPHSNEFKRVKHFVGTPA